MGGNNQNIGPFAVHQSDTELVIKKGKASGGFSSGLMVLLLIIPIVNLIRNRSIQNINHQAMLYINVVFLALILIIFIPIILDQRRNSKSVNLVFDRHSDEVRIDGHLVCPLSVVQSVRLDEITVDNSSLALRASMAFWTLTLHRTDGKEVAIDVGQGEYRDIKALDLLIAGFAEVKSDLS